MLYLYPENIREFHRNAQGNGLAVPELGVAFCEMTEFRIEDADGICLRVGQAEMIRTA